MQSVAGSVRNMKIVVMKGLKNYAKLYLMHSYFNHHQRNVTVTQSVTVVKSYDCDFKVLSQNCEN